MSLFGPDYDEISGVEDAKQKLSEWEWGCDSVIVGDVTLQGLLEKVSISAAGVVIDEMERSFNVLFSAGDPPHITIWPIGLDHPEFTISLARLVDNFIRIHIDGHADEDTLAFSTWLRTTADRVDAREAELKNERA